MRPKFLITLFLLPIMLLAQERLTPEKLWQLGRVSAPLVSPDAQKVLYEVRRYDLAGNNSKNYIHIVSVNGGTPQVISTAEQNAYSAKWRPDGKKITFLSAQSGKPQVYEMNPDGSDVQQVTNAEQGINYYKYAPTLDRIAYAADVKLDQRMNEVYSDLPQSTARLIDGLMFRHWDSWHDYAYSHLFVVNYNNGKTEGNAIDIMDDERYDAPLRPHGGDEQFNWSPDGKRLAYTCRKLQGTLEALSTNSDIYLYDVSSGKTTNLTEQNTGYDRDPAFSPDGKKIAWLSMRRAGNEADKNRLMVYYFDSKFQTEVTQSFDNTVNSFAWAPTSQTIYFIPTVEATKNIYSAREVAGKSGFTFTNLVPVTKGDHDYIGISIQQTADKKQTILVGAKQHYSLPTELFIIDAKGMERQLTYTNKAITDNIAWGNVEKRWVTTTDGKKMLTWVIYPPNLKQNKRYPALLYCQGGPQSPVSQYFSYRWNFQLMAANGYIIIAPNRRGLPGFGSEWNDQIIGDYGGQPMKDLLSATDDAMTIPFIDRNRMGAVGASFGGYSVYWLAGNHNKRFKAFVSHCGMYNMESWYGSTEEMWFANNDNQGPYWNIPRPKNYDASPHKFVKNWDTPILIIHNEKDFRVPLTQGIEAFTAAQSRSIPSKFLYFPDENHWVTKPQNSVMWQRVFFEWLDTYLK